MKKEQGNIRFCPHFFFSLPFVGHHTDIKTTQIYAKVTNTKLNSDISAFENKISGRFDI